MFSHDIIHDLWRVFGDILWSMSFKGLLNCLLTWGHWWLGGSHVYFDIFTRLFYLDRIEPQILMEILRCRSFLRSSKQSIPKSHGLGAHEIDSRCLDNLKPLTSPSHKHHILSAKHNFFNHESNYVPPSSISRIYSLYVYLTGSVLSASLSLQWSKRYRRAVTLSPRASAIMLCCTCQEIFRASELTQTKIANAPAFKHTKYKHTEYTRDIRESALHTGCQICAILCMHFNREDPE